MFGEETKLKESAKDALRGYLGMNYIAVIILIFLVVFRTCQSVHRARKKWWLCILPQYLANLIQPMQLAHSHILWQNSPLY